MKDKKIGLPRIPLVLFLLCALLLTACGEGFSGVLYPPETLSEEPASPAAEGPLNPDAEVRGIWIATAANINYPSAPGLPREKLAAELDDIVETAKAAGLNAIFFQVRPAGDSLCRSAIFPVSEVLSGKQGEAADGDFDPLAYLIGAAHREKIAVHAWVNPFRVTTGSADYPRTDLSSLAESNPARQHPGYAIPYADGRLYYDPGNPAVRELVAAGVRELAENYDLEGIVFDDYFYPYPVYENELLAAFDDTASYLRYGGQMTLSDWRRANINETVRLCHEAVRAANDRCLFGIAPFGIWQNDDGQNGGSATAGLESYSSIYCDPLAWVRAGTVDYLAPQIYWDFSTRVAPYGELVRWWNAALSGSSVRLLVSHGLYRYAEEGGAEAGEIGAQVTFARAGQTYRGSVHFGYAVLKNNIKGAADELRALYSSPRVYPDPQRSGAAPALLWPAEGTRTGEASVTLVGTADPAASVTAGGRPVSLSKEGVFAVSFPLAAGENRLTVTADGRELVRTVVRTGADERPSLTSYRIDGAPPADRMTLRAGETLALRCLAPYGSTVTATLGGETVRLTPAETLWWSADPYTALVYTGALTLPEPAAGEIRSLGVLSLEAVRGAGETARAECGEVRVIPSGSFLSLKAERAGVLLRDSIDLASGALSDLGLPAGTLCFASEERGGYYRLSFGEWAPSDAFSERGTVPSLPDATVHKMLQSQSQTGETLVTVRVINCFPAFRSTLSGDTLTLTFPGAVLSSDAITRESESALVGAVAFGTDGDGVSVKITFKDRARYRGATVYFDKAGDYDVMTVRFREPASGGLSGKKIRLLPLAGREAYSLGEGRSETELLAAFSGALRAELEKRGASVLSGDGESSPDLTLLLTFGCGSGSLSLRPANGAGIAPSAAFCEAGRIRPGDSPYPLRRDAALLADPAAPALALELGDLLSPEDLHRLLAEEERAALIGQTAAGLSAALGGGN